MQVGIFYNNIAAAFRETHDPCAILENARRIGFDHVEADYNFLIKQDENFFECAEKFGIGISVYALTDENCVLSDGKRAEDILGGLHSRGVPALMLVCGLHYDETGKDEVRKRIVDSVNRVCERADFYQMDVLFEDYDSYHIPCATCSDLLSFGKDIPGLKYTYDTGNFTYFGDDPFACFEKMKDRIAHVHVKDRVSAENLHIPVTGDGYLPLGELLQKIKSTGYDGRFSIEMSSSDCNLETVKRALLFVRNALK